MVATSTRASLASCMTAVIASDQALLTQCRGRLVCGVGRQRLASGSAPSAAFYSPTKGRDISECSFFAQAAVLILVRPYALLRNAVFGCFSAQPPRRGRGSRDLLFRVTLSGRHGMLGQDSSESNISRRGSHRKRVGR